MGADEEGTLARLELIDPTIAGHRGRIVKTTGDGMLVEFVSVFDAVRCAVNVQRAIRERETDLAANGPDAPASPARRKKTTLLSACPSLALSPRPSPTTERESQRSRADHRVFQQRARDCRRLGADGC